MSENDFLKNLSFQSAIQEVDVYGLILMNLGGQIVTWNRGAKNLLGYDESEVVGRNFEFIFTDEDQAHHIPQLEMARSLERGYAYDDRWHVRKDGSRIFVNGGLCLLKSPEGTATGFVKIIRDQTERKQQVEKIEELNANLSQAHKRLGEYATNLAAKVQERTSELNLRNAELQDFCYSIAHDLRAPLRSIQAMSQVVIEDYGPVLAEAGRAYLERISKAGQQLDQLTLDLLAYTRFSREEITLVPFNLEQALDEVLLSLEQTIIQKKAEVRVRRPLLKVKGQHAFVIQILSNFLSNALKFVPPDLPPAIEVWTETENAKVRIYIKDNGIGILPEYQAKVFDLFERLHGPGRYEGTGAGLAIARKAAQRMNGEVGIAPGVGGGSTFWLELDSTE